MTKEEALQKIEELKKYIDDYGIELYNTFEKAENNADWVTSYPNGDYRWVKDGVQHLMRNGVEIAKGDRVYSYDNGDYKWTKDGVQHLMRDGVEIARGDSVLSYPNGDYEWEENGINHYCRIIDGYEWERIRKVD